MKVKVMFPPYKSIADIMALNCVASMKSTRTGDPAHVLVEQPWRVQCQYKPEPSFCKKCDSESFCLVRLIDEAKRMKHWGILEHFFATVSVSEISRALTHQLVRHRLFSYAQQSQRHVNPSTTLEWFVTPETMKVLKPMDGPDSVWIEQAYAMFMSSSANMYAKLLKAGIPEEDARYVLINACHTHIVISGNARNWMHFFKLRLDKHAQWEIRGMAKKILAEFMTLAPIIFTGAGELDV